MNELAAMSRSALTECKFTFLVLNLVGLASGSFFEVQYPNVDIFSEANGNVTIQTGQEGNIIITPGEGGKVFIGDTEFLHLATMILSLPPIWSQTLGDGRLGTFQAGKQISAYVAAQDPEGGPIRYYRISGALPAGVVIDPDSGRIHGQPPDVDAVYKFGVRAMDNHGKYADSVFTIEVRAVDQCAPKPCKNGGVCQDGADDFTCLCKPGFGGKTCDNKCVSTALGVDSKLKRIPDAFLSAYLTLSTHDAVNGRLNDAKGWVGTGKGAWLQVSLGNLTEVYAVSSQNSPGGYVTTAYNLATSVDGAKFTTVSNGTAAALFTSGASLTIVTTHVLAQPQTAKYIRFLVSTFTNKPGLRVEIYGCTVLH